MSEKIGFEIVLKKSYENALTQLSDALKAEGFGILTQIDVQNVLKEKIGADFRKYAILGVCNPKLAFRALTIDAEAGLMLPCGVTIESEDNSSTTIRIGDPLVRLKAGGYDAQMQAVGDEAREKLLRVADALKNAG